MSKKICRKKIIAFGVSKKNIPKIKKDLKKKGYSQLEAFKGKKYYNITYKTYKGKC